MTDQQHSLFVSVEQPTAPPARRSDIVRLIAHKEGWHRELREGRLTGQEFLLAELENEMIVRQFRDGAREPAVAVPRVLIEDALRFGYFVEVDG